MPSVRTLLILTAGLAAAGFGAAQFAARRAGGGECREAEDAARSACYHRLFTARLDAGGLAAAVAALDSLAAAHGDVAVHAHEYAHGIGIEAYARSPDIAAAFATCGDGYSSGCRHGVIQAYFEARDSVSAAVVADLCRPFKGATASRWVLFQCVHGMGHGLTMFHGHDLPRALTDCDLLGDGWDRESCYGGAFMESVINATTPHHPATRLAAPSGEDHHHHTSFKAIDPADPLHPCSIMAERYLHACYQMQTSVILHLNGGDIRGAARQCDRAPQHMRPVCYQSLGRDITAYTLRDPDKTVRMCGQGSEPYRPACYVGAAKALVDWTATTDVGLQFCSLVARESGAGGMRCYHALGEEIATLRAAAGERASQCARAGDAMAVAACRRGAGLR